jgi:hypothetical protein
MVIGSKAQRVVRTRGRRKVASGGGGDAIFRLIPMEVPAYQGFSRLVASVTAAVGV